MAGEHNMVIQSLTVSDLCWCFLLQHFFANLQDKMDQKHFEQFHTTVKIRSSVPQAGLLLSAASKRKREISFLTLFTCLDTTLK